ncbi:MAG: DUF2461 family protein, partial [Actinomycetota bacterium]
MTSASPTGSSSSSSSDAGAFAGFPDDLLPFLAELGAADKTWFQANKKRYRDAVTDPMKAFVVAMGDRLREEVAPGIVAEPKTNGSIGPITNDLRFNPDRSPYKDHVLLRFWEGSDRKTSPTLFLRVGVDGIGYATGAPIVAVERWRELVDDESTGAALADALVALGGGRDLDIDGQGYKRVPKPYADDHPRADLLRHKMGLQARWLEPIPESLGGPELVDHCAG